MKKMLKSLIIAGIFIIFPLFTFTQNPPHPGGGSAPGSGNTPVGGGAPVGEGIILLLTMGVAYGVKKVYNLKRANKS